MDWDAFVKLLVAHKKKTIGGALAIFVAGTSAGGYLLYAEQCHAQAQSNEVVIQQLLEYQQKEIAREEMAKAEERRKKQYISKLCLTGKLKDKDECAKVGLEVKDD